MNIFRNLKRDSGVYLGRKLLEALEPLVNREDVLEIRKSFPRSDLWEKRQIIRLVNAVLEDEEKRPWIKNLIKIDAQESFLLMTLDCNFYGRKFKNKRKIK